MRWWWILFVAGAGAWGQAALGDALPPATQPAQGDAEVASPATRPAAGAQADEQIHRLIAQLADPDPSVREQATSRLRKIGKPALAALKDAADIDDPEIRSRAQSLVRRIENGDFPGPVPGGQRGQVSSVRMSVRNGTKVVDVVEGGRTYHITEDGEGIIVAVTGMDDGEKVTRTYRGKDAAELKQESPEAFAIYDRLAGGRGPGWVIQGPMVGQGGVNVIGPVDVGVVVDPLDELKENLNEQMKTAGTAAKDRQDMLERLGKLQAMTRVPAADAEARDQQLQDYFKASDALRDKIAELKLGDPGTALPPSAKARLGVEIRVDPDGGGLLVQRVVGGSRAQKLGMKMLDVIQRINNRDVATVEELRAAVAAADGKVVVEGMREHKAMKWEEKP